VNIGRRNRGVAIAVHARMHTRLVIGSVLVIGLLAVEAAADPVLRFGLTSGANRNSAEAAEVGPMFAFGAGAGRFVGEVTYSYLSFMDPDTAIHRSGVAVRADIASWGSERYWKTLTGEVGVSHRWGSWRVSEQSLIEARSQNEVHASVGYQLDTKWQLALRVAVARRDPMAPAECPNGFACSVSVMPTSTGLINSVMLEWMFMLGR
jgi:hypothetical protein